ncbi:uncharacterized protein COLE_05676 [Cutaneotrichosporon oleaginosum]|uniref:uncharacterized protein n=1 Tax=Cutaneotrichosporon oleaginosum TaxID=879819 RepID=UPI001325D03B|nr:hypothetical protein COLE_05676 [Cutaneotrichosporon oleaginosum]
MSDDEQFDEVVYETRTPAEAPSRECHACRKMKIKCIDKEKPPCKRCKQMKIQCRFVMGPMPRQVLEETEATKSRLEELEGHVSGIYKKLDQMTDVLSRLVPPTPASAAGVSPTAPPHRHPLRTESYEPPPSMTPWSDSSGPPSLGRNPFEHVAPHHNPTHMHPPPHMHVPPPHSHNSHTPHHPHHTPTHLHAPQQAPMSHERERLPARTRSSSPLSHDDMLEAAAEGEPFRHFTKQEEDAHILRDGGPVPPPARKRKRNTGTSDGDEWEPPIRERGDLLAHALDPITSGQIPEDEARHLFDRFFKYSHPFVPVFDPKEDTFEHMRKSPLCMTVILMVALRHREAAGEPSALSRQLKDQAEHMVKLTLFSPVATLETVQGLTVLVHYSEHAWRTCCHATALAVDMRLYRCLPYLHKIRTARHPNRLLERQRPLVAGARVWLALMRLSYEMSFNHSLPIQFNSPHGKRTQYARDLLDHPLSNLNDSRLVTACEMCELREIPFRPHESLASQDQAEVDRLVRMANRGIHELEYFTCLLIPDRIGLPNDHFLRIELDNQKAYCIMYTNSPAWHGVHKKGDIARLNPERQGWVAEAMRCGAFLVSCLANKRLEEESEFGNHGYYVGIVATSRYLIRMCELLPTACDLQDISLNIDKLLLKLPVFAAGPFADGLRRTLRKAREQGILPYTRISDAAVQPAPETAASRRASAVAATQYPGFNPFPWQDPVQAFQVTPPAPGPGSATGPSPVETHLLPADPGAWPDEFNLAAWFPSADEMSVDISALDDMANWFPAAPQVWQEPGGM